MRADRVTSSQEVGRHQLACPEGADFFASRSTQDTVQSGPPNSRIESAQKPAWRESRALGDGVGQSTGRSSIRTTPVGCERFGIPPRGTVAMSHTLDRLTSDPP